MCNHPSHYLSQDLRQEYQALWRDHPQAYSTVEWALFFFYNEPRKSEAGVRSAARTVAQTVGEAMRPGDVAAVEMWHEAILTGICNERAAAEAWAKEQES